MIDCQSFLLNDRNLILQSDSMMQRTFGNSENFSISQYPIIFHCINPLKNKSDYFKRTYKNQKDELYKKVFSYIEFNGDDIFENISISQKSIQNCFTILDLLFEKFSSLKFDTSVTEKNSILVTCLNEMENSLYIDIYEEELKCFFRINQTSSFHKLIFNSLFELKKKNEQLTKIINLFEKTY